MIDKTTLEAHLLFRLRLSALHSSVANGHRPTRTVTLALVLLVAEGTSERSGSKFVHAFVTGGPALGVSHAGVLAVVRGVFQAGARLANALDKVVLPFHHTHAAEIRAREDVHDAGQVPRREVGVGFEQVDVLLSAVLARVPLARGAVRYTNGIREARRRSDTVLCGFQQDVLVFAHNDLIRMLKDVEQALCVFVDRLSFHFCL